jgi:RimJ/RimL family protein N-acetyltransferase
VEEAAMKIRPYSTSDFSYIKEWNNNEKVHALWCANLLPYPLSFEDLHNTLKEEEKKWNQYAFTVIKEDGTPIGFFCLGLNYKDNSGFLKFVILDNNERGKGFGTEMINKIMEYSFIVANLGSIKLVVFDNNIPAIKGYKKAGFVESTYHPNSFQFGNELWGRYFMNLNKSN